MPRDQGHSRNPCVDLPGKGTHVRTEELREGLSLPAQKELQEALELDASLVRRLSYLKARAEAAVT